jgi:hypothetical protein
MADFKPEFDVKMEGHAIAKYLGPKDDNSLAKLLAFHRSEKWRGQLVINYPGNGGINDVVFTEKKRATIEASETGS